MALDWRPLAKPKPGFEERFKEIFTIISDKKFEPSFWGKLIGKKPLNQNDLLQEWFDNSIKSYVTIKAPMVGKDTAANDWAKSKYQESDKSISEDDFIKRLHGYYVIELAEEQDGVPIYISLTEDRNVFRAQFLKDCVDIIGEDLLAQAWVTKLADEALKYGNKLMQVAEKVARENNMLYLKNQRLLSPEIPRDSLEARLHIVFSAANWLIFYGKNGHGYEASF
jgi:hypothetical protein